MIKNENLIIGECYFCKDYGGHKNNSYILKYLGDIDECPHIASEDNDMHKNTFYLKGGFSNKVTRLATAEEKHYLEECMIHSKFIPYDEAMLTFNKNHKSYKNESKELVPIYKKLLNL